MTTISISAILRKDVVVLVFFEWRISYKLVYKKIASHHDGCCCWLSSSHFLIRWTRRKILMNQVLTIFSSTLHSPIIALQNILCPCQPRAMSCWKYFFLSPDIIIFSRVRVPYVHFIFLFPFQRVPRENLLLVHYLFSLSGLAKIYYVHILRFYACTVSTQLSQEKNVPLALLLRCDMIWWSSLVLTELHTALHTNPQNRTYSKKCCQVLRFGYSESCSLAYHTNQTTHISHA